VPVSGTCVIGITAITYHWMVQDNFVHFIVGIPSMRMQLKPDAIPSIFAWTTENKYAMERSRRLLNRQRQLFTRRDTGASSSLVLTDDHCSVKSNVGNEVELHTEETASESEQVACEQLQATCSAMTVNDAGVQTVDTPPFDYNNFMFDPEGLHYYTGLETYSKFMYVLTTLGYSAYHLNYYRHQCEQLAVPNQFLLTLMKLRMHIPNFQLSRMFGISESSVSNIFITWINFMAKQWSELNLFPDRDLTTQFMPDDFRHKFPQTRVIIDGMECPVKKPKNPVSQQATFSYYKNMNTVKSVVGSTPGGLVCYISPAYGGSTSDRQIIERSQLGQMCEPGDSIMADKGFNIQDIMAANDVHINIPTFLKKANRFNPRTLSRDRNIASKRVHIEHHIGLAKTFKILRHPLTLCETALASEVIFVCFMLCNFRSCIVPHTA